MYIFTNNICYPIKVKVIIIRFLALVTDNCCPNILVAYEGHTDRLLPDRNCRGYGHRQEVDVIGLKYATILSNSLG